MVATRLRSSSEEIASRCCDGSKPSTRSTALVDLDNSQITGVMSLENRSMVGATASATRSARCSAIRLATSSPSTMDR